jgi:hypothetical protein
MEAHPEGAGNVAWSYLIPIRCKAHSECESVVFCGAAARLRRAAALCSGGGQPAGLAAAQNISLHSEWFLIANGIRGRGELKGGYGEATWRS